MKTLVLSLALVFAIAAGASAQCPPAPASPVANAHNLCFLASPNHAQIDGYKVLIKKASDGTQVAKVDVGKPAPDAAGAVHVNNFSGFTGLAADGTIYVVTPIAYIGTLEAPDGNSNSFFALAPPGTPVVTP